MFFGSVVRGLGVATLICVGALAQTPPLPAPSLEIPREPPIAPMVITAQGRRFLLNDTDVTVSYDANLRRLVSNRPGWWIVNYPLEKIRGYDGPVEGLSQMLFGAPREYVRNWYLKTPGTPGAEPAEPTLPAPIDLTPNPNFVVDQRAPNSSDSNAGSAAEPLLTIGEAVRRAQPGTVIRVHYGLYRETLNVELSGTAAAPIVIEGVRSPEGLPIVDGQDPVPAGAWVATEWPAVYRADFAPVFEGLVTLGPHALIERNLPSALQPGEFANNRASREFIRPAIDGRTRPAEGEALNGRTWRLARPDSSGLMNLRDLDEATAGQSVYWASTWVWVEPSSPAFDPAKPAPAVPISLMVDGTFRAFRASGAPHSQQSNLYRVWVNGNLLPSSVFSTAARNQLATPRPHRNSGSGDEWFSFPFREGWNHLMFQLDTTVRPQDVAWRFRFPNSLRNPRSRASTPVRMDANTGGLPGSWIAEYLILGPFPAQPDRGVYVRMPDDSDPNLAPLALPARNSLANLIGDHIHVRGFEFRHGAQYQQRGQVLVDGRGNLLEGSMMIGSEVQGIECKADKDGFSAPVVIRNNWILDPGNVGFGCGGLSDRLTPGNLNLGAGSPGRSPVIFEHNLIRNANWAGFEVGWAAGGSKNVQVTGMIFRYNTILGGSGPGVWMDWENYGNRIEGNLIRDVYKYAIGVEASPGPNLIANNVLLGFKAQPGYDSSLIASWDSSNTWAVNNTLNGYWNGGKGWVAPELAFGMDLGGGGVRPIRFGPQKSPKQTYLNNIVLGFERAFFPKPGDVAQANFSEFGAGGIVLGKAPEFMSLGLEDYRLQRSSALSSAAERTPVSSLVVHDFNGLLRHRTFPDSVGAFRSEPLVVSPSENVMEIEYEDGVQRLVNAAAPVARTNAPRIPAARVRAAQRK